MLLILEFQSILRLKIHKRATLQLLHQWFYLSPSYIKVSLQNCLRFPLHWLYTAQMDFRSVFCSDDTSQPKLMLIIQQRNQSWAFCLKVSLAWLLLNNFLIQQGLQEEKQTFGCSHPVFHPARAELHMKGSHLAHHGYQKQNMIINASNNSY